MTGRCPCGMTTRRCPEISALLSTSRWIMENLWAIKRPTDALQRSGEMSASRSVMKERTPAPPHVKNKTVGLPLAITMTARRPYGMSTRRCPEISALLSTSRWIMEDLLTIKRPTDALQRSGEMSASPVALVTCWSPSVLTTSSHNLDGRPKNRIPECSESKNGHPVALVTMLKPIRADNFISQPRRSPKEPHDESHEMVLVPDSDSAMEGRYWYVNRNRFPNQYGDERYQRCEDPRAQGRYAYDGCAPKNRDSSVQQENEPGDPSAGVFCSRNFVSRPRDPRTPSVSNHYSQSEEQQLMQGRTQRPQVQKSAHSRPSVNRPP